MTELRLFTAPFDSALVVELEALVIGMYQRTGTARVLLLKDLVPS
jgi:hypothetical protein